MNASKTRAVASLEKYKTRAEFQTYLFEYDSRGLVLHSKANKINCPAGRILTETGRRLRPEITPGVSTLMVSVYDEHSMLRGYINPNDTVFERIGSSPPKPAVSDAVSLQAINEITIKKSAELEIAAASAAAKISELERRRQKAESECMVLDEKYTVALHGRSKAEADIVVIQKKLDDEATGRKKAEADIVVIQKKLDDEATGRKKAEADIVVLQKKLDDETAGRSKAEADIVVIQKKLDDETAGRKKAEADIVVIQKKLDDEVTERKKIEDENAARKKADADAIRKKAEEDVAAAARKKAEEDVAAAARKKAEEDAAALMDSNKKAIIVTENPILLRDGKESYIEKHMEVIDSYLDILNEKISSSIIRTKVKGSTATCIPYAVEDSIISIVHYSNFSVISSAAEENKLVHFILTNYSAGTITISFDTKGMSIGNDSKLEIPGKAERTCILSCISDGKQLIEYARSKPLPTPKSLKF
jgi:galactitol-specific phosphotransferase system IIB component